MIPIRLYRSYWLAMGSRLGDIGTTLFARTEDELARQIKEISENELILVAVVPSADTMAPDHDNVREKELGIVYSLIKVNRNNMDDEDMINAQEKTQLIIRNIKQMILWDAEHEESEFHHLCRDMDLSRMHTDPEWNFLGCDGYSLSIQFNTPGF